MTAPQLEVLKMANVTVTNINLTIHRDLPHRGDECTVNVIWDGGAGGFRTSLTAANGIMQATDYADDVEYDPESDRLYIIFGQQP